MSPIETQTSVTPQPDLRTVADVVAQITTVQGMKRDLEAQVAAGERLEETARAAYEAQRREAALRNGPLPSRADLEAVAAALLDTRERIEGLTDELEVLALERQAAQGRERDAARARMGAELARRRAAAPELEKLMLAARQDYAANDHEIQRLQIELAK
jgi:hypothetical protein